jgi:hypothetical protein
VQVPVERGAVVCHRAAQAPSQRVRGSGRVQEAEAVRSSADRQAHGGLPQGGPAAVDRSQAATPERYARRPKSDRVAELLNHMHHLI